MNGPFRPPSPIPTSRQLADRLLAWHAELTHEIERNDVSAEDLERSAEAQVLAGHRCAEEAAEWLHREPDTYLALMGCSARYILTARVKLARAAELRE